MTDTPMFGALPEEERPDLTPLPFTIRGYDADGEPQDFVFHARASTPLGSIMTMLGGTNDDGEMNTAAIMHFLNEVIITEDRKRWVETLDLEHLSFSATMLGELGEWLGEVYMQRPTQPRSARRASSRNTRSTSGAKSRVSVAKISG